MGNTCCGEEEYLTYAGGEEFPLPPLSNELQFIKSQKSTPQPM